LKGLVAEIKPQTAFPGFLVGPVALEAMTRKNGADIAEEIDFARGGRERAGQGGGGED
jgi:hypothetical protein